MKSKALSLLLVWLIIATSFTSENAVAARKELSPAYCCSKEAQQLHDAMRKLWTDHVVWTHSYIVAALSNTYDKDKVLARLLRNQQDIGNAVKPYYGEEAGNKLAELLKEHIVIAGKLVDALAKNMKAEADKQNKEWFRNADDIARFLSSANPNWPMKELQKLLYVHLQMLTDAVSARIAQDTAAEIDAFDRGFEHILVLSDTLSNGIVKQFPDKFQCRE
jgi:hypothetical protein